MAAVLTSPTLESSEILITDVTGETQRIVTTWAFVNSETSTPVLVTVSTADFGVSAVLDQDFWDDIFAAAKTAAVAGTPGSSSSATNPIAV